MFTRKAAKGMAMMLSHFKLTLDGRHHSGIDDCRNIAKLAIHLHTQGVNFECSGEYVEGELVLHVRSSADHDHSCTSDIERQHTINGIMKQIKKERAGGADVRQLPREEQAGYVKPKRKKKKRGQGRVMHME